MTLGGSVGFIRMDCSHFPLWKGVVVLKKTYLENFHLGRCVVVLRGLISNIFPLSVCIGLERPDFWTLSTFGMFGSLQRPILGNLHFSGVIFLKGLVFEQGKTLGWMVVFKGLILSVVNFGRMLWS